MKKIDFETLWGGVFGIFAVLAAVLEMIFNGISMATIAGAVKDITGTLAVIMVFLVAIRQIHPKKDSKFDSVFYEEMEKVINKYEPLIKRDNEESSRYLLASNLDSFFDKAPGSYHVWFDLKDEKKLQFSITKTVFMGRTKEDFSERQALIASRIANKLNNNYEMIDKCETNTNGIKIVFKEILQSGEDAKQLANIVDYIMFLYIAENKK